MWWRHCNVRFFRIHVLRRWGGEACRAQRTILITVSEAHFTIIAVLILGESFLKAKEGRKVKNLRHDESFRISCDRANKCKPLWVSDFFVEPLTKIERQRRNHIQQFKSRGLH